MATLEQLVNRAQERGLDENQINTIKSNYNKKNGKNGKKNTKKETVDPIVERMKQAKTQEEFIKIRAEVEDEYGLTSDEFYNKYSAWINSFGERELAKDILSGKTEPGEIIKKNTKGFLQKTYDDYTLSFDPNIKKVGKDSFTVSIDPGNKGEHRRETRKYKFSEDPRVAKSQKEFINHFTNPITIERALKLGLSRKDLDDAINNVMTSKYIDDTYTTRIQSHYDPAKHETLYSKPGHITHEMVHASNIDTQLGIYALGIAKDYLVKPTHKDILPTKKDKQDWDIYYFKPTEFYANLYDMRSLIFEKTGKKLGDKITVQDIIDLKPTEYEKKVQKLDYEGKWEKHATKESIKKYHELNEGKLYSNFETIKKYINPEGLSKILNTIAAVEESAPLLEKRKRIFNRMKQRGMDDRTINKALNNYDAKYA